jgi:peptidoglycan hydrolase CwlO-like protein
VVDYVKAKALSDESVDLARKILDARLKLTRLRQAYPQPRLTIPIALTKLDAQVEEMQQLQDNLQDLNEQVDDIKDQVKLGAREVERLRVERAEVDKLVKQTKSEIEDGRVLELCDWYASFQSYFAAQLM